MPKNIRLFSPLDEAWKVEGVIWGILRRGPEVSFGPQSESTGPNGENMVSASVSGQSNDFNCQCSLGVHLIPVKYCLGSSENWTVLLAEGHKPSPCFHHAAAVVGSKIVVVGGDSGHGLLDDRLILSLDKLTWAAAAPKVYSSPNGFH